MSEKLRLRSLDLLHVAYAHFVKEDIEALGDERFLEARKKILKVAKVEVCSIEELKQIALLANATKICLYAAGSPMRKSYSEIKIAVRFGIQD